MVAQAWKARLYIKVVLTDPVTLYYSIQHSAGFNLHTQTNSIPSSARLTASSHFQKAKRRRFFSQLSDHCRREKLPLHLHLALLPQRFVRNSNLMNLSITNGLWMQLIILRWTRIRLHSQPLQSASHRIKYKTKTTRESFKKTRS